MACKQEIKEISKNRSIFRLMSQFSLFSPYMRPSVSFLTRTNANNTFITRLSDFHKQTFLLNFRYDLMFVSAKNERNSGFKKNI